MSVSAAERLRRFYKLFSNEDRVLVLINADPDAISSAMAVKRLMWRKVNNVTIANVNVIKRPDNIAMISLLGVNIVYINDIDIKRFSRVVLVDSQPDHHECFTMVKPDIVIDHHPETCPVGSHIDIRPKYGATATIMTEYLRAAKISPSVKLATALFYAIKTDTSNFVRTATIEDIRAFQYLFKHANMHLVRRIEQVDLELYFLKYFELAIKNKIIRRGRLFVHLGRVLNPDLCVILADFFMRVNSIKWSIVSGLYEEKLIVIFRNDGLRKDAGKIASQSFGQIGSAGGHKSMARAEIPILNLEPLINYNDIIKLQRWIIDKFEKRTCKIKK